MNRHEERRRIAKRTERIRRQRLIVSYKQALDRFVAFMDTIRRTWPLPDDIPTFDFSKNK